MVRIVWIGDVSKYLSIKPNYWVRQFCSLLKGLIDQTLNQETTAKTISLKKHQVFAGPSL